MDTALSDSQLARLIGPGIRNKTTPMDIKLAGNATAAKFGKFEVEFAAGMLVKFLQRKNSKQWSDFSLKELVAFYESENEDINSALWGIMGMFYDSSRIAGGVRKDPQFVVVSEDGSMVVTNDFIEACVRQ